MYSNVMYVESDWPTYGLSESIGYEVPMRRTAFPEPAGPEPEGEPEHADAISANPTAAAAIPVNLRMPAMTAPSGRKNPPRSAFTCDILNMQSIQGSVLAAGKGGHGVTGS